MGTSLKLMKMDFDEAVKHDFENWIKKMSNRGVILLHDTQVRRDEFGVWKLWEELSKKYPSLV